MPMVMSPSPHSRFTMFGFEAEEQIHLDTNKLNYGVGQLESFENALLWIKHYGYTPKWM